MKVLFMTCLLLVAHIATPATVLPVESFSNLPDVSGLTLSPNGKYMAFLVRINTGTEKGTAIGLRDLSTNKNTYLSKSENKKFLINWLRWANNHTLLLSTRYPAIRHGTPTTETRLLQIDIRTGEIKPTVGSRLFRKSRYVPQFQDNIVDILPDDPDHYLLSMQLSRQMGTEVIRIVNGKRSPKTIQRHKKDIRHWITDRQHRVRIGIQSHDTETKILTKDLEQKSWRVLWEYQAFSQKMVSPLGFAHDPNILFYRAYHEGRLAIFKVNITSPKLEGELVFADPNYDIQGSLLYSHKNQKVIGITHSDGNGYSFWDKNYRSMQKSLDKVLPETSNKFHSMSDDERRIIVLATSDINPGTYYLWDRTKGTLEHVAYRYRDLAVGNMVEKNQISYIARDGLKIEGFLTRPNRNELQPTIIFPHGGPISYDGSGFDYWTQFFANRGYTVLQMNFRGSFGYGYDFMQSGLKNWGLQMQNDVEDGTRWLIKEKIADPNRICVVGASYGGYAALMEIANNKELYQCAVSFAGVTDLPKLVSAHRQFTNYGIVKQQIGSDMRSLRERSPISRADEMDIPILLVHGTKDRVVRINQSRSLYNKLKKLGKDVKYVEQEDGNHHLSNEVHRVQLFKEMDRFLGTHLN